MAELLWGIKYRGLLMCDIVECNISGGNPLWRYSVNERLQGVECDTGVII